MEVQKLLLAGTFSISMFVGPASGQLTGESAGNFVGQQVINFIDPLVVSNVNSWPDFVAFILLPLLGLYAISRFLAYHAFLLAEENFHDNTGYGSSGLSDMGKSAANLIGITVGVVGTMFYGGFSLVVVTALGLIGVIWFIWQFLGGALQNTWSPSMPSFGNNNSSSAPATQTTPDSGIDTETARPTRTEPDSGPDTVPDSGSERGDIDVDNSSQAMAGAMQQVMQQQQQQNQAMMQFMGLLMGQMQQQGQGVRVTPPGNAPPAMLSPQVVNQFQQQMNMFSPQMINQQMIRQMMKYLSQDQKLTDGDVEKLLGLLKEWEHDPQKAAREGKTEAEITIENSARKVQQNQAVQNIASDIDQDQRFSFMSQKLRTQLFALFSGSVRPRGKETLVAPESQAPAEIDSSVIEALYEELVQLDQQGSRKVITALLELEENGLPAQLNQELVVKIGEIIRNIGKGGNPGQKPRKGSLRPVVKDIEEEEEDEEETFEELEKALKLLQEARKRDQQEISLDQDLVERFRDAMDRFRDAMQHSEHIEKLINQADDPMEAAKIMEEDDKDLDSMQQDIEKAYSDLNSVKEDLKEKHGDISRDESAEAKLEELEKHIDRNIEELEYYQEALSDQVGSPRT